MATTPKPRPFARVYRGDANLPQRKCACNSVQLISAILNLEGKIRDLEAHRIELLESAVERFHVIEARLDTIERSLSLAPGTLIH